jgi:flagella basal body P-ring formation protein FlgA
MIIEIAVPPIAPRRFRRFGIGLTIRLALALGVVCLLLYPVMASDRPVLRAEVTAQRDVIVLSDLLDGVPTAIAERPVFRAPALGESGTIQASRIADMARDLGAGEIETMGMAQVFVTRAARRIGSQEIDSVLRKALEQRNGLDARNFTIVFDGSPPSIVTTPESIDTVTVRDLVYDPRSRRIVANLAIGEGSDLRRLRVSGQAVETVEVAVAARSFNRGDSIGEGDILVERRARDSVPHDGRIELTRLAGQVARRPVSMGAVLRAGDLSRPEIVARNETVLIFYETPGLTLTLRGKANEAGALGDSIVVVNTQSKKSLQATIVGPGRVQVTAPLPGRLASAR